MAGSHSTRTPLMTLTIFLMFLIGGLLGVVGGDEVVQNNKKEKEDAHQVGEHGQLYIGNHFARLKF